MMGGPLPLEFTGVVFYDFVDGLLFDLTPCFGRLACPQRTE